MNDKEMITAMENLALPDITQNTGQDMKEGLGKDVIGQAVDLLGDNIEIGLDMTIDNELLKEIPIIGNFVKAARLADTIHNRYLIIKLQEFVEDVKRGRLEEDVIREHRRVLEEHPQKREKEMTNLILSLERLKEKRKARILSKIYMYYLKEEQKAARFEDKEKRKIKMEECWIDFCILEEMLEDISMYDYPALVYAYKNKKIYTYSENLSLFQVMRLERCGVMYRDEHGMLVGSNTTLIRLTPQGKLFCVYFVKCFSQKSERNIPNFRNGIFPYISRKHFHMIMVQSVA